MKSPSALVAAWAILLVGLGTPAVEQDEAALRSFFEGRRVRVTIDMPGTAAWTYAMPAGRSTSSSTASG